MKMTAFYTIDRRTELGVLISVEEETMALYATDKADAVQQVFDAYEQTPHSVHIERVREDDEDELSFNRLDDLTTANSCFRSFDDLLNAKGDYRPTIDCSDADRLELADGYDAAQAKRNDPRRAFRSRDPLNPANRPRREYETKMHNDMKAIHQDAINMNREWMLDNEELIMTREEIEAEIKSIKRDIRDTERAERRFLKDYSTEKKIMADSLYGMQRLLKRAPFKSAAQFAQTAVKEARATIDECRNSDRFVPNVHFTHRGVEILAINADGERAGNGEARFLELKELSGKALAIEVAILMQYHGDEVASICIQGGIDAHESLATFLEAARNYGDSDYDPLVDEWEVSAPIGLFNYGEKK